MRTVGATENEKTSRRVEGGGWRVGEAPLASYTPVSGRVWRLPCQREVAVSWWRNGKEGPLWTVPLLIEMYPTQANPTSGWICDANAPFSVRGAPVRVKSLLGSSVWGEWTWRAAGRSLKDPMGRGRERRPRGWGWGTALCQGCPGYGQKEEAWYSLTVLEEVSWYVLFCVSLHRCGDAPIPAALVSSPLAFDDQHTHTHTPTHIVSWIHTSERSLWCPCRSPLMLQDRRTLSLQYKLLGKVWQSVPFSCFYDGLITIVWEITAEPTDWLYAQWGAVCEWLCGSGSY